MNPITEIPSLLLESAILTALTTVGGAVRLDFFEGPDFDDVGRGWLKTTLTSMFFVGVALAAFFGFTPEGGITPSPFAVATFDRF